jgi:hypothetical protein
MKWVCQILVGVFGSLHYVLHTLTVRSLFDFLCLENVVK